MAPTDLWSSRVREKQVTLRRDQTPAVATVALVRLHCGDVSRMAVPLSAMLVVCTTRCMVLTDLCILKRTIFRPEKESQSRQRVSPLPTLPTPHSTTAPCSPSPCPAQEECHRCHHHHSPCHHWVPCLPCPACTVTPTGHNTRPSTGQHPLSPLPNLHHHHHFVINTLYL